MRLGADGDTIDERKRCALNVGNEVAVRTTRDHRDLPAWLAMGGERFCELEFAPAVCSAQDLDYADTAGLV